MLNSELKGQHKLEITFNLTTEIIIWKLLRFVEKGKEREFFLPKWKN